jgi:hypothetical protein
VWLAIVGYAVERVASGEWTADSAPMGLALEAAWDAIAARQGTGNGERGTGS